MISNFSSNAFQMNPAYTLGLPLATATMLANTTKEPYLVQILASTHLLATETKEPYLARILASVHLLATETKEPYDLARILASAQVLAKVTKETSLAQARVSAIIRFAL
jgi:hypothetical protein